MAANLGMRLNLPRYAASAAPMAGIVTGPLAMAVARSRGQLIGEEGT